MGRSRVILFLDFDGVLHTEGEDHILNGGADFCFLPRASPLRDIDEPFSNDIRACILGMTP